MHMADLAQCLANRKSLDQKEQLWLLPRVIQRIWGEAHGGTRPTLHTSAIDTS